MAHHHNGVASYRDRPSTSVIPCQLRFLKSVAQRSIALGGKIGPSHPSILETRLCRGQLQHARSASDSAAPYPSAPDESSNQMPPMVAIGPSVEPNQSKDLQNIIASIPYRKILIWSIVAALSLQLNDFFGIVMGTYIISFLGNAFVDWTSSFRPSNVDSLTPAAWRKMFVVLYFGAIVSMVTLFGVLTIPDIAREGAVFVNRLQSDNVWVVLVEKMRHGLGDSIMESLEKAIYLSSNNDITTAANNLMGGWRVAENGAWTEKRSVQLGMAIASMLKGYTTTAAKITAYLLSSVTRFAVQLAILQAFQYNAEMFRVVCVSSTVDQMSSILDSG
eukprot:gene15259-21342_t